MQAILGLISEQVNAVSEPVNKSAIDITSNHHFRLLELIADHLTADGVGPKGKGGKLFAEDIHDFELSLVDNQPPTLGGANDEFVFSARLDNLFSSFCAIEGLADAFKDGDVAEGAIPLIVRLLHP